MDKNNGTGVSALVNKVKYGSKWSTTKIKGLSCQGIGCRRFVFKLWVGLFVSPHYLQFHFETASPLGLQLKTLRRNFTFSVKFRYIRTGSKLQYTPQIHTNNQRILVFENLNTKLFQQRVLDPFEQVLEALKEKESPEINLQPSNITSSFKLWRDLP